MNQKYLLAIQVFALMLLAGCEKRLDLAPVSNPSTSTFYKDANGAAAAVTACYAALQGDMYGIEAILTPTTVAADDGVPFLTGNADRRALWSYTFSTNNNWSSSPWTWCYIAIQRCNVAIERIPGIGMDDNLIKRYVAEAKFIRAMMYFNLVRFYGGVSLVTKETLSTSQEEINVPRSSLDEVYTLIENDLKDIENTLPTTYTGIDKGRVTKGAAKGLLAKVYLTRAGNNASSPYWAQAAAKAKEVIDLNVYDLWANFKDVFEKVNRGGKESVFEIMFSTDVSGNFHSSYWTPRGDPRVPFNGFGTIRPTKSLYDLFAPADARRNVTFLHSYVNSNTGATVNLTIDNPNAALAISFDKLTDLASKVYGGGGKSFPYMRFSEILLVYAEALNESNGSPTSDAYNAVNRIRQRAGLANLISGLSRAQFRDSVITERRKELAFEGHRWFDLVRTGVLLPAVNAETSFGRNPQIKPHHILFPIPLREMGANPALVQNPGYN